jgi:hypothetical protein
MSFASHGQIRLNKRDWWVFKHVQAYLQPN